MSQRNVEIIRDFYAQFARGDFSALAAFPTSSSSSPARNCPTRVPTVTLREGETVRVESFPERAQALDAAGLSD